MDKKVSRDAIIKKWDALGFLDGLKGHVDDKLVKMYECCKTTVLQEKEEDDLITDLREGL